MVIETRFEIVNAIIHNPMEAVILFALAIFAWKYFGDERRRHYIWRDFHSFWMIDVRYFLPRLVHNKFHSYCRLKVEYIDPARNLLSELKENQSADGVLSKYLGLHHPSTMQLIRALENLGYLNYEREVGWTPTKKLLVASGDDTKSEVIQ